MKTIIKWLPEAQQDLKRLYDFLSPHSLEAAKKVINIIIQSAQDLAEFPEKGPLWESDSTFRYLNVRFGAAHYHIRYRLWENQIIIIRIWHERESRDQSPLKTYSLDSTASSPSNKKA